ncbi:SbtR family transcriptional regulator [Actinoplanes sp. NPDC004185]
MADPSSRCRRWPGAGVGQATLYRHFPDRSAPAAAVVAHHLQRLETCTAGDACRPSLFRDLLREVLHNLVAMRPLVLLARRIDPGARDRYQQRLPAALAEPLRRAQTQGYVRSDVTPADLLLLLAMVQGVAEGTEDRAAADRSIDLVLDGVFHDRT